MRTPRVRGNSHYAYQAGQNWPWWMQTDPVSQETVADKYRRLSPDEQERVRLKQRWEECSMLAVYRDWPDLFESVSRGSVGVTREQPE